MGRVFVGFSQIKFFLAVLSFSVISWSQQMQELYLSYEQRLLTSYIAAGMGESRQIQEQYIQRMRAQIERYAQAPSKEIKVQSFKQFLMYYRGVWPESYSLESDLSLIEKARPRGFFTYKAATPELQRQINKFIIEQNLLLAQLASQQRWPQLDFETALRWISAPSALTDAYIQGTKALANEMRAIETVGDEIAKQIDATAKGADADFTRLIATVLKLYFKNLGPKTKKQILNSLMGQNLAGSAQEKFEILISASGPQFQKLLQVIARQPNMSAELVNLFKKLESRIKPIPPEIVRELFEAERSTYNWKSYELRPLGTGTMAQVHKGVMQTARGDKTVVIRFLKPEIEERVREDHHILSTIAPQIDAELAGRIPNMPKIKSVVDDLYQTVSDELSLKATVARQKMALPAYTQVSTFESGRYKNYIQASVPNVYFKNQSSKLHVQDLVPGKKLDSVAEEYQHVYPDLKKQIVEAMANMWFEEALFKSGFFHSDLHQGNFMVDFTDDRILVSILDFGMGGRLSHETQKSFMLLSVGLELNEARIIAEAFWRLREKEATAVSREEFLMRTSELVQQIRSGRLPKQDLDQWVSWAMNQGIKLPYSFVSLQRGLVILNKALEEAGSKKTMTEVGLEISKSYLIQVIKDLRSTGVVSVADLARMGWMQFQDQKTFDVSQLSARPAGSTSVRCDALFVR